MKRMRRKALLALMSVGLAMGLGVSCRAEFGTTLYTYSTSTKRSYKAAYVAAAGEAANFVQMDGAAVPSPLLRDLMDTERAAVGEAQGAEAAAQVGDVELAGLVALRAEELQRP